MSSASSAPLRSLFLGATFGLCLVATLGQATEAIRPEVGKPLQAAEALLKYQKYPDALARLHAAEAVGDLTPYETSLINQLRGMVAAASGDQRTAAHSFEAVLAYGHQPAATRLTLIRAVIGEYYGLADYPKVVQWVQHYAAEGGNAPETLALQAQALYLANDFAGAKRVLGHDIAAAEQAGRKPSETQLQLLVNSTLKLNDHDGYAAALERLVAAYPKVDYWAPLLRIITGRAGFPEHLALDGDRLALATGALGTAPRYVEFAELALQAGLPGEAKAAVEKGFSNGALGVGADADRHRRLRTLIASRSAEDIAALPACEREATAANEGAGLVNTGLAWLGYGDAARAADLIQRGIAKGGLKRPDEAWLHLGIARLAAGQKGPALEAFAKVGGTDGTADLARLWRLHATAS